MALLNPTTDLVCYHHPSGTWVKSVGWFKPDGRTGWRTVLYYTNDIDKAVEYVRYEWVRIFEFSKHRRITGHNFRLETCKQCQT